MRTRPACGTKLKSTRIPKHFPTAIGFPDRNWKLPGERVDDAALGHHTPLRQSMCGEPSESPVDPWTLLVA